MRIQILADETWSPEGHPEVVITYGALTRQQFTQQIALQFKAQEDLVREFNWWEFILRHGIRSVDGLEIQRGEKIEQVKADIEIGPYGERLTDESWNNIVPFLHGEIPTIAFNILQHSRVA